MLEDLEHHCSCMQCAYIYILQLVWPRSHWQRPATPAKWFSDHACRSSWTCFAQINAKQSHHISFEILKKWQYIYAMADQPPRNAYCLLHNHFVHLFAHLDIGITSFIMSSTCILMILLDFWRELCKLNHQDARHVGPYKPSESWEGSYNLKVYLAVMQ